MVESGTNLEVAGLAAFLFKLAGKHFFGIDGEELSAAAREHRSFGVAEFGTIVECTAVHPNDVAFDNKRLTERYGTQVIHFHVAGERNLSFELESLAHCLIENGRDDASVGVAGRSGKVTSDLKLADVTLAAVTKGEFEVQTIGIGGTASETDIALPTLSGCVVIMGVLG